MILRYPLPTGRCGIAWTDITLNPGLFGCGKVSPACRDCYAEMMAARLAHMGHGDYALAVRDGRWTGRVAVGAIADAVARVLAVPRRRDGGLRYVFVTSMSDILHEDVPLDWIVALVEAMSTREDVIWQLLTKRAERWSDVEECLALCGWPPNVWPGVTVESDDYRWRLDHLPATATTTFASVEPLLGPLHIERRHMPSWVIVGGESGATARPMAWPHVYELRDRCAELGSAFFLKQASGARPRKDLGDCPADLRVREMPRRAA